MAGLVSSQGIWGDKTPSCARILNDSNTRHVKSREGWGVARAFVYGLSMDVSGNVI